MFSDGPCYGPVCESFDSCDQETLSALVFGNGPNIVKSPLVEWDQIFHRKHKLMKFRFGGVLLENHIALQEFEDITTKRRPPSMKLYSFV